jgi:hypothetical protein
MTYAVYFAAAVATGLGSMFFTNRSHQQLLKWRKAPRAKTSDLLRWSNDHLLGIGLAVVSLLLFAVAIANAQTVPPPTQGEVRIFNRHATHENCSWAIDAQKDVAKHGGSAEDWRWVAVGWKMCVAEMKLRHAPPPALHVAAYELDQACNRLLVKDPEHIILACVPT